MKKFLLLIIISCSTVGTAFGGSMFDDEGNYSGNWKQMTNVKPAGSTYKSSDYYSSTWYAQQKMRNKNTGYRETVSTNKNDVVPYRYNTLEYTRVRQMHGADGKFSAKCSDIGDASFCY